MVAVPLCITDKTSYLEQLETGVGHVPDDSDIIPTAS